MKKLNPVVVTLTSLTTFTTTLAFMVILSALSACSAKVTTHPNGEVAAPMMIPVANAEPTVVPQGNPSASPQAAIPATGQANAKAVLCTGAEGEFYMNFPQIAFQQDQFGQTEAVPGDVTVGFKLANQAVATVYDDPYMTAIANGNSIILQTNNTQDSFTAFFYVDGNSPQAWVQGTGDLKAYAFDGNNGSMSCQFYQGNVSL